MAANIISDAGGFRSEQAFGEELDYTLDWSDTLEGGETVAASAWTATPGVVAGNFAFDATSATAWVSGGLGGRWYEVVNTVTTSTGRVYVRAVRIYVRGALPVVGSLFTDPVAAVSSLRRDRLVSPAMLWMAGVDLTDEYLLEKLLSAERMVERRLRVFLTPREVVPDGTDPAEIAALEAAGHRVEIEPGYDHDPRMSAGEMWGLVELRHRPVIKINAVKLSYPSGIEFPVPADWVRADRKYGRFQLVPTQLAPGMAISGMVLSAMGAGRSIPLAIRVKYRAGLEDVATKHPDILSLIKKAAVLDILGGLFLPANGSTSVDGLSQSFGLDMDKWQSDLDAALERVAQSLHGIRLLVA